MRKRIFLRDFAEYFQLFDIKHSVKYEGRDEKGEFIVFKNALLETRQDDILRIGPWVGAQMQILENANKSNSFAQRLGW